MERMGLQTEEIVKRSTLKKYKILCAVLLACLVIVALGLGLGFGLKKTVQVSCRYRCNETLSKSTAGCSCDDRCKERQDCCWDYEETCVMPTQSWSCTKARCGETRMSRSFCSCSDDCLDKTDCCTDYKSVCKGLIGRHLFFFPWMALGQNIWKHGALYCQTLKNSGLYAESHGIIDNSMYDVNLNQNFSLSGTSKSNPAWWSGQPIWHTAMYQGLRAGTYFWPGSDVKINGTFPNIYMMYNGKTAFEARVSELLNWLDRPKSERPDFYTLYIEEPDKAGHSFGPVSGGTIKALQLADRTLGMLMEGLKQRNLHNCVNLIVLADHGMDKTFCNQMEYMTDYFDKINFYMYEGPAPRIRARNIPKDFYTFDSEGIVKNLTCRKPYQHFKPYLTQNLPKRLHYVNNIRIDKVHLMVDRQWLAVRSKSYTFCGGGNHGYDNEFKSMEAIFVAHGPGFKEETEVQPFENIEVYNLMCDLLKIKPAPNNGTHGSLNHLLKVPFYNPSHEKEVSPPSLCPFATSSSSQASGCSCDSIQDLDAVNQRLNLDDKAQTDSESYNLPYGRPRVLQQQSTHCLLYQHKYVNGYSQNILMPLWSSYTVSKSPGDAPSLPPTAPDCLRLDVRIPAAQSQNCSNYQPDLNNITHGFLYPPNLNSSDFEQYDALLTSNIVPMYKEFKRIWDYFHNTLLQKYITERNGLNVISGPIFDYDSDGHFDSLDIITQHMTDMQIPIPTHYFIVLTSCENQTNTPLNCSGTLQVLSFILPHRPDNSESCAENLPEYLWVEERMQAHAARVRDVELLTGLDFYQGRNQPLPEILQLKTFLPTFETLIY
ncbi:ectonucleotide pyrophosphatase/phosphodiesterase family member 3 isoform X3 [Sceloporus undulatus]|uniref:ectonucleotide pyrophosphatase/phosphodiesterase family member 3 isoform X3 n=1 Tax=Sceloporus undulatus TaxID=8520 RepID=UPI001C4B15BB|nr:ectonucleotide pyrophosphatase/phosphodiesterase family member 3 isoform X3 [Sceloporus undulatus]